ncbi:hypothetical protein B0A55_11213 [Friedmanniomyces simplex]|uniref:Uncharacterized protein n=1 Tax=Friedmanniomyces simplex TaxID=329884 RepID=A0A4U0WZ63_9PEZI|nr:hypothetical protein B0A55_11213 [Friedmanniomyces simplex]
MAHLRLARWLHIHKLYEELSRHIGGRDVDGFVVMIDADLGQTLSRPRALAQCGNPRNLELASIAERMMDHAGGSNGGGAEQRKSKNSMKRLRRVGQRLQRMVHRWGLGMMRLTDAAFARFIDIADRIEGHNIRAVSDAAAPVVQLFMDESPVLTILRIEAVEEDVLYSLARLSQDMQALFMNAEGL